MFTWIARFSTESLLTSKQWVTWLAKGQQTFNHWRTVGHKCLCRVPSSPYKMIFLAHLVEYLISDEFEHEFLYQIFWIQNSYGIHFIKRRGKYYNFSTLRNKALNVRDLWLWMKGQQTSRTITCVFYLGIYYANSRFGLRAGEWK